MERVRKGNKTYDKRGFQKEGSIACTVQHISKICSLANCSTAVSTFGAKFLLALVIQLSKKKAYTLISVNPDARAYSTYSSPTRTFNPASSAAGSQSFDTRIMAQSDGTELSSECTPMWISISSMYPPGLQHRYICFRYRGQSWIPWAKFREWMKSK
jgi:hypothetical protein